MDVRCHLLPHDLVVPSGTCVIGQMGVIHCRAYLVVAGMFLDLFEFHSLLEQHRNIRMSHGVGSGIYPGDPAAFQYFLKTFLQGSRRRHRKKGIIVP